MPNPPGHGQRPLDPRVVAWALHAREQAGQWQEITLPAGTADEDVDQLRRDCALAVRRLDPNRGTRHLWDPVTRTFRFKVFARRT